MAAILETTFSNAFASMKIYEFGLKFHPTFVPQGPFNNKPALVQMMAWHRTGALLERMMACFADAYMHHWASVSLQTDIP